MFHFSRFRHNIIQQFPVLHNIIFLDGIPCSLPRKQFGFCLRDFFSAAFLRPALLTFLSLRRFSLGFDPLFFRFLLFFDIQCFLSHVCLPSHLYICHQSVRRILLVPPVLRDKNRLISVGLLQQFLDLLHIAVSASQLQHVFRCFFRLRMPARFSLCQKHCNLLFRHARKIVKIWGCPVPGQAVFLLWHFF